MADPTPAAAPAPSGSTEDLGGGTRVTVGGDAAAADAANVDQRTVDPKAGEEQAPALPEGYKDWAEYGQAVASGKVAPAAAPAAADPKAGVEAPAVDDPRLAAYTEEYTTNGELSPESVTKAAKEFGVSEDMVKTYVAGLASGNNTAIAGFHEAAGGAEGYAEFQQWAETGLTEAQQTAYNAALDSNPETAKVLLGSFIDSWKAAGGGAGPRDLSKGGQGGGGEQGAGESFQSWAQVTQAMNDPRYSGLGQPKDPAYIAEVEQKLGRSNLS